MSKTALTEGPVGRKLLIMTLPMFGGILSMISFTLVDTYFVSRLGTKPLAAMSFTFPVAMVLVYFISGVGVGTASVVARAIGSGDQKSVKRFTTDGLLLGLLFVALEVVIGLATMDILFPFLGARGEVLVLMKEFMGIWYIGIAFFIMSMIINNIIRATGDVKFPSIVMIVSALINVILDPVFIFGWGKVPAFGIRGAAIATSIAFVFSLAVLIHRLFAHDRLVTFEIPSFKACWNSWKEILRIGLPSGFTNVIINLAMVFIMRLLAPFGETIVAGFGVAVRIEELALAIFHALGAVLAPFTGQNWGAKNYDRVHQGLNFSFKFCVLTGVILAFVLIMFGKNAASIFDKDTNVILAAYLYLLIVPFSYGARGIMMMVTSYLNALGKPFPASVIAVVRTFGIYIPLAYVCKSFMGITGIFIAALLANMVTGFGSFFWSRPFLNHLIALQKV